MLLSQIRLKDSLRLITPRIKNYKHLRLHFFCPRWLNRYNSLKTYISRTSSHQHANLTTDQCPSRCRCPHTKLSRCQTNCHSNSILRRNTDFIESAQLFWRRSGRRGERNVKLGNFFSSKGPGIANVHRDLYG